MDLQVASFIDGGYLDAVIKDEFGNVPIDYAKLADYMADGKNVLRTGYYHCPPYNDHSPQSDKLTQKFNEFVAGLSELSNFSVRLGRLERRGYSAQHKPIYMQKRVDVLFALDLAKLAMKGKITHAVIFTGDSDMIPAVQIAKDEGVHVTLIYGSTNPPHEELYKLCDVRVKLTDDVIELIRYN